ncbi:MAG: hypothetical protein U1E63_02015 [Burkholderiales bacterium]
MFAMASPHAQWMKGIIRGEKEIDPPRRARSTHLPQAPREGSACTPYNGRRRIPRPRKSRNRPQTAPSWAALADGAEGARERAELERIAQSLGAALDLAQLKDAVNAGASDLAAIAQDLSPTARQSAFELAVCVQCRRRRKRRGGRVPGPSAGKRSGSVPAMRPALLEHEATMPAASAALAPAESPRPAPNVEEQDRMILNYAMLNGALELLPQSLASMAIIALQMKMVYRIGMASYGFELDQGSIRDFAATAGAPACAAGGRESRAQDHRGILGSFGGSPGPPADRRRVPRSRS